MNLIAILIIGVALEVAFKPRLDYTHGDQLLLWYGRENRKHFLIFDNS